MSLPNYLVTRVLILLCICILAATAGLQAQQPIPARPTPGTSHLSTATEDYLPRLQEVADRIMQRLSAASRNAGTTRKVIARSPRRTNGQPVPTANLSMTLDATNTTCGYSNGSIQANVSGGTPPYQFTLNNGTPTFNNQFSQLAAGNYTVVVIDANSLFISASVTLTNTYTPPTLSQPVKTLPSGCTSQDGSVTLSATGGAGPYLYSKDGINYQSSTIFTNLSAGNYIFYVRDANSCISTLAYVLTINSCQYSIGVNFPDHQFVCHNEGFFQVTDVYNGNPSFTYSLDNINYQSSNLFTGLGPGLYTVYIKDGTGTLILVYTMGLYQSCPVYLSATTTPADCGVNNGSITATGSGGAQPYQYTLNPAPAGTVQNNNVFQNLPPGTYRINITDYDGATNWVNATVAGGCPQLSAVTTNSTCGQNNGVITATVTGGFPPYQFQVDGNAVPDNNPGGLAPGLHHLSVTDSKGSPAAIDVTITATPNPLSISVGPGNTICEGKSYQLTGTTNGDTLWWLPRTGLDNAGIPNPIATPGTTTKYYFHAGGSGCTGIDSVLVQVLPAPLANAGKDTAICLGTSVQLHGSGGQAWSWDPVSFLNDPNVSNPISIHPDRTMKYSLTVTDGNGCSSILPATVTITVQPETIRTPNDTSVSIAQQAMFIVGDPFNNASKSYTWTPYFGLDNPYTFMPVATYYDTGTITYHISSIAPNGCQGVGQLTVHIFKAPDIFIPNAFTPNGDGHNDQLKVIMAGIRAFKYLSVYNRWGQQVFYTTNAGLGWDGNFSGTPQRSGTFVWVAEAVDYQGRNIRKTGTVMLIR